MGCVVPMLVRLATMSRDGSARHRSPLAPPSFRLAFRHPGRPEVAGNIRDLIRRMSQAKPLWGAPRIHGELLKLGIAVAQSTVARYLPRHRKPPSQSLDSDLLANRESASTRSAISGECGLIRTEFSVGTGCVRCDQSAERLAEGVSCCRTGKFDRS
jgi:hypothetical protein